MKSLLAFGCVSALPLPLLIKFAEGPKVHLIGLGHLGCQSLKHVCNAPVPSSQANVGFTYTFVDEDLESEQAFPQDANILKYKNTLPLYGFGNEQIIWLAAIGEAQAAAYLKTACLVMKQAHMHFSVVAFLPFRFEGLTKRRRAESCLEVINQLTNCEVIDMEDIRREHGALLFVEAFKGVYVRVAQLVFSKTRRF